MPKVSVIIPTYNRADLILEAIESVTAQTFKDYEIIIVDDGSTDSTAAVLEQLINSGTINYVYQNNQGESAARNHAMRLAQGQYYAFLDSDDLFLPTKLEKQVAYLDAHVSVGLVHSLYRKFSETETDLGVRDTSRIQGNVYPEILLDWSVLMAVPCVLVRAKVIAEVGGFDEQMRWGPDLDLWRRISRQYAFGVIPEVLSKIRVHSGNISGDKAAAVTSFERYLQKAFNDDSQLDDRFQRRAYAKLYSNVAHNILADGVQNQQSLVRSYSIKALSNRPLQLSAYLGWLGSWLPDSIRSNLLSIWRQYRYQR